MRRARHVALMSEKVIQEFIQLGHVREGGSTRLRLEDNIKIDIGNTGWETPGWNSSS